MCFFFHHDLLERGINTRGHYKNVLEAIHSGVMVLMHDGAGAGEDRTKTIESMRQFIPKLQEQGYKFVPISDLLSITYKR